MTTSIMANGRAYRVPQAPTMVLTVDGGDPEYFRDALERGQMPRLAAMLTDGGQMRLGASEMPSLTNPNNLSIVTGVSPALHGIPGNYCRLPDGSLQLLNSPEFLRAPSIHSVMHGAGVPCLMVTAKDKLRRLLGHGNVPSVSVEKVHEHSLATDYGIDDIETLVGRPAPGVYDFGASHYAMEIGLAVFRANPHVRLMYVSLTDRVQHAFGPGTPQSDEYLAELDRLLGEYLDEGFVVGITADHGMSAKHGAEGDPNVIYLADHLDRAGIVFDEVVLPITDPYVKHHGALGSFAWVYLPESARARAIDLLSATAGIEEIYGREEAASIFEHPADRIGDLAIVAGAATALGTRSSEHDLTGLHGPLRSHGGRHEQLIPLIVSHPVTGDLKTRFDANTLRSRDVHELVLNHLAQTT
ncbi:phosphonoacetate hydrolase [Rhodococcus sp. ABRD24]|uniref:alkaline phosphatase family protein n=1 Tax=Rhodococcus sp. ABRD24 TaxID=2507582 RepID=UPI0010406555|nr:alkaline phosphatase family protein [Rhodococcus sp. ABRD24]QBJ97090.1 phosphonoacetate hydrolase [Rhodococcus sp. ABRD24]